MLFRSPDVIVHLCRLKRIVSRNQRLHYERSTFVVIVDNVLPVLPTEDHQILANNIVDKTLKSNYVPNKLFADRESLVGC